MKEEALKLADAMEGRAKIRRQAKDRLSVQEGKNDRLSDQLEQASDMIRKLVAELDKQGEPVAWMYDNGTWKADTNDEKVWIESDDFKHDAILYVYGDFADIPQQLAYAKEIESRLNKKPTPQTKPLSDDEILKLWHDQANKNFQLELDPFKFARAIEERLGVK